MVLFQLGAIICFLQKQTLWVIDGVRSSIHIYSHRNILLEINNEK